ncbi:alpha/beta hydrolase [Schlegelella sp. S2-27]|uniref:Alpha/beta hydrolase n=1 Tax=Caldimonas mangrovi TaxID=2944811 RepID=A0ABT0YR78_9BURK|nr:alpha/beta hydrolase [Caldimonas mangrovi]MCM5680343.1 alpha/beta hydrolase [Caldimonas mangrovi]
MIEHTLVFGPQQNLVGTLTFPDAARGGSNPPVMALLTNAGVIPRVGPHRMNVKLARRFAQLGVPTLRFDLSGLGDSQRAISTQSASAQFVADTRAAMDLAASRYGCHRFFMIGFCSGADIAHLTALEDSRLQAALLFDSYVYPTRKAKLLGLWHRLRRHGVPATAYKLARYMLRARLDTSQDDGTGTPAAEGPVIFGRSRMPARDEFGARIRTLVDRGVQLYFVYSGGEPDWYNYEGQFCEMFESYGFVDDVRYTYLRQSDHTLTQPHAQQALTGLIEQWLHERVLGAEAPGSVSSVGLAAESAPVERLAAA